MTSRDFCYWLQGYFEIAGGGQGSTFSGGLSIDQVATIRAHLAMVFIHEIDPSFPKEQQAKLTEAHAAPEVKPLTCLTCGYSKCICGTGNLGGVGPGGVMYRC